ncbi:MAG: hypothetical protein ACYS7Y_27390 [Planctomycetota bacterium]|jgi:hypothetical protein
MIQATTTTLSKVTTNKAKRYGLGLSEWLVSAEDHGVEVRTVEIATLDEDGEPADEFIAVYRMSRDGAFVYEGTCLDGDQDLPAWICDEKHLRDLLPEFAVLGGVHV